MQWNNMKLKAGYSTRDQLKRNTTQQKRKISEGRESVGEE